MYIVVSVWNALPMLLVMLVNIIKLLTTIILNCMKPHKGVHPIVMIFTKLKELNIMFLLKDTNNYKIITVKVGPTTVSKPLYQWLN